MVKKEYLNPIISVCMIVAADIITSSGEGLMATETEINDTDIFG